MATPESVESDVSSESLYPTPPSPSMDTPTQLMHIEPPRASPASAARAVYLLPELRSLIYGFLDHKELARFMRVERMCMEEVPKELYRIMKIKPLLEELVNGSARQERHRALVEIIHAQGLESHYYYDRSLSLQARPNESPDHYSRSIFNWIVPTLRARFPNLRSIHFGSEPKPWDQVTKSSERDAWVVNCSDDGTGTIEAQRTLERDADDFWPLEPPSRDYTMRSRVNLSLGPKICQHRYDYRGNPVIPPDLDEAQWRLDLLGAARIDPLHHVAVLDVLPISLGEIGQLIQRQIDAGYTDLLQQIEAEKISTWNVADFRNFSSIASSSLRCLRLRSGGGIYRPELVGVTFDDLPDIIAIFRAHLPNLEVLSHEMNGADGAEAVCGRALSEKCLKQIGSIQRLEIFTDDSLPHPLNLVRLLFGVCGRKAQIRIGPSSEPAGDVNRDQTDLLYRLEKLPYICRRHIATIDYRTLGVTTTDHAYQLTYRSSGQPIPLWEARSADWRKRGDLARDLATKIGKDLIDFADKSSEVQALSLAGTGGREAAEAAQELLAALKKVKKVEVQLSKILNPAYVENDITEYADLLGTGTASASHDASPGLDS